MSSGIDLPPIDQMAERGTLRTFFQPIVSVRRKMVAGMEALIRGIEPDTGRTISPKVLFDAAAIQGKTHQLDRIARNLALQAFAARSFSDQFMLFLNIDLDAMLADSRTDELLHLIAALQIPPTSIVVELVENQFDDVARLNYFIARVREHGIMVAIDDVGAGHSNLERISLIKPDILKIDRSLCGKLGADHCTEEVFSALVNLGRRIGSLIVAEGIETRQQAMVALERGADLLQGYLVLQPQASDKIQIDQAEQTTATLAGNFRQHMVDSINFHKVQRRTHNILIDSLVCDISQGDTASFGSTLARSIQRRPEIECVYVLDHRGQQVTETIFNTHEIPPQSLLFRPAEIGTDHSLKVYYNQLIDSELSHYITDPYVSMASGQLCQTLSSMFRDGSNERMFVLCVDVKAGAKAAA